METNLDVEPQDAGLLQALEDGDMPEDGQALRALVHLVAGDVLFDEEFMPARPALPAAGPTWSRIT